MTHPVPITLFTILTEPTLDFFHSKYTHNKQIANNRCNPVDCARISPVTTSTQCDSETQVLNVQMQTTESGTDILYDASEQIN